MTNNQTMFHHVWPRHLYLHDGTCTCSGLRRRRLSLVEFHIGYILDHAIIYEMSALMTRFQFIIRYLHPLRIFFSLYIVCGDDHTWHFYIMHIHGHCTLMYPGLVYGTFCGVLDKTTRKSTEGKIPTRKDSNQSHVDTILFPSWLGW